MRSAVGLAAGSSLSLRFEASAASCDTAGLTAPSTD